MEILHKAALAFAEDGYHQTSVNTLAARLGVSKPVLYYYAKNKDDLLFQCGEIARQQLWEATESAHRSQLSGAGKLRRFFATYAEIMCGDFGRCLALVEPQALSPSARVQDVAGRRLIEDAVIGMITEGQSDGSLRPTNTALTAKALFGAFNGIPRWFHQDGAARARDVADTYIDLFVTGIGRG